MSDQGPDELALFKTWDSTPADHVASKYRTVVPAGSHADLIHSDFPPWCGHGILQSHVRQTETERRSAYDSVDGSGDTRVNLGRIRTGGAT